MRTPQILAIEPEFVKEVLVKNFKNFHDNDFAGFVDSEIDPIFSRNPLVLAGEDWKEKRSEITPAFTPARVYIINFYFFFNQHFYKNLLIL